MGLGIPGKGVATHREDGVLMGRFDVGGVLMRVCREHAPEVRSGACGLVHDGDALATIDEAESKQGFNFLEGTDQIDEREASPP